MDIYTKLEDIQHTIKLLINSEAFKGDKTIEKDVDDLYRFMDRIKEKQNNVLLKRIDKIL